MNSRPSHEPQALISLGDIYFVLFRHKWKILFCSAAGLIAAFAFYLMNPPPYESEAKLFIRYVLDTGSLNPSANNSRMTLPDELGASIMNSEMQILTSFDLFKQVATNVGPDKILAGMGGGSDAIRAASIVKDNLTVEAPKESSVLHIIFRHPNPAVVQPVLNEIIVAYLAKHLQVHQAPGTSDEFLTEETSQLHSQILHTEEELFSAKTNAGITSVEDAQKFYATQIAKIRDELFEAQTQLAERQVLLTPAEINSNSASNSIAMTEMPDADDLAEYQRVCARLAYLEKTVDDYLTQQGYTEQNKLVKEKREQINQTTELKKGLEKKNLALASLNVSPMNYSSRGEGNSGGVSDVLALQTKIRVLKGQLSMLQTEVANVDRAESKISDLQHKKQIQEKNYEDFATSLQQAQINETLGPGRVSNIDPIQRPSPPFKNHSKVFRKVGMFAIGGILAGLAWAFLIELYLDRSVKRAVEVESKLHLRLFLSIPDISRNGKAFAKTVERRQLSFNGDARNSSASGNGKTAPAGELEIASWEPNRFLHRFHDALRDRLVVYFESINLTRKPKLVAVTSTDKGSGVSTTAAGLAASLSETGDGRVLLVDMNDERGAAQQFFRGKVGCKLDDALVSEKRDEALVSENLYVVTEGSSSDKLSRVLPKRFASLVPKLKASDYDYIIFDMPPVSPTSVTTRLAGFMDMVLLVIESEKTEREIVQRANALLEQSKASVGIVLNKTRKYVPDRLQQDFQSDI
jgi:succinoglycan biosynthesis transport protein ExoP